MDQYITGALIKCLRENKNMTQSQLAELLMVSDKTISKWETGKGYPDISLVESIASVLGISVMELISGNDVRNSNVNANMLRSKFYVCPKCGNVIYSTGEAMISCHGIVLPPLEAEDIDEQHMISIELVEDEYFVQIHHDMTKNHYISFIAAVSDEGVHIKKLYPEGNGETRFNLRRMRDIYFYCNRDGLFKTRVGKRKIQAY